LEIVIKKRVIDLGSAFDRISLKAGTVRVTEASLKGVHPADAKSTTWKGRTGMYMVYVKKWTNIAGRK